MAAKKKASVVHFRTKLGTAKGQPRSRIWIEGKRLADAGFTVGTYFVKKWSMPDERSTTRWEPHLQLVLLRPDDVLAEPPCKVSGKGEKPIIDITGEKVREFFGACATHVDVEFRKGLIVISAARGSA